MITRKKGKPRKPCLIAALVLAVLISANAYADTCTRNLVPLFNEQEAFELCATFTGSATISSSLIPGTDNVPDIGDATHAIRSLYLGTSLIFNDVTASDELIKTLSVDGADSNLINVTPGGAYASTRGAGLQLNGNEQGTNPADAYLESGSASTGDVFVRVNSTNGLIRFATNSGVEVWNMNAAGTFIQNATNGGDVEFQKAATGVRYPAATVLTPAADLTPVAGGSVTTVLSRVVSGAPTTAVVALPAATANIGKSYSISNEDSDPIRFVPAGADTVCGRAAATPCVCAGSTLCTCTATSASTWGCK